MSTLELQRILARLAGVPPDHLDAETCQTLADALHLPRCSRDTLGRIPAAVIALLPPEVAAEHHVVPVGLDPDGDLRLAMVDPTDAAALREVEFFAGRRATRELACAGDVAEALKAYYGVVSWPATPAVAA